MPDTFEVTDLFGSVEVNDLGGKIEVTDLFGSVDVTIVGHTPPEPLPGKAPDELDALQVWYRMDAETYANNTPAPTFTDQSGFGRDAVAEAVKGTYLTNQLNGKPVVRLGKEIRYTLTYPHVASPWTFIYVIRGEVGTSKQYLLNLTGGGGEWYFTYASFGSATYGYRANIINETAPHDPGFQVLSFIVDPPSSGRAFRDGLAKYSGLACSAQNIPSTARLFNFIFGLGADDGGVIGEMAETVIYDRALNDSERVEVEQHLAAKYAIDYPGS